MKLKFILAMKRRPPSVRRERIILSYKSRKVEEKKGKKVEARGRWKS